MHKVFPLLSALCLYLSAPGISAATPAQIAAARACEAIAPHGDSLHDRSEWHRKKVRCLTELYADVGAPATEPAAREEIHDRVAALERAYHDVRALCRIRNDKGADAGGCGTVSLSPAEFRCLLKHMIYNEDAGWVRPNPALAEALGLEGGRPPDAPDRDRCIRR